MLTRDFGKITVLAKGVRKSRSKTAGILRPFAALQVSCLGKSELKMLTQVELISPLLNLTGIPLFCGFYLNDLIQHFLQTYDPYPKVYFDYRECLSQLTHNESPEKVLRLFEINLLENIGYALPLDREYINGYPLEAGRRYDFHAENGACENPQGAFSGELLIALRNRNLHNRELLIEAKKLLRTVIDYHLPGKKLYSRILIAQHQKYFKSGSNG